MLSSYRNRSIDLQSKSIGFYMRETFSLNGLCHVQRVVTITREKWSIKRLLMFIECQTDC